jgi:hypothetical protein
MSSSFLVLLALVGLYLYLRGRAGERALSDADAVTLAELAAAGSDLYRDHEMEFFVYIPERGGAEEVARTLEQRGFTVEVGRPETDGDWLCVARRPMRPVLSELQRLRREFSDLAASRDGAYDGWGTTVVEETGTQPE